MPNNVTLNSGTTIIHPPIPRPNPFPFPGPIVPAPTITALSPTSAAAGQTVTVTGTGFGETQGLGYLAFSDAGTNWGAPGNQANFQILSWSNTQIQFMVPEPSGPGDVWAVRPGSSATVFVAVPGLQPNTVARSGNATLLITGVPSISSLSLAEAAPGDTVVVTGQNFGAQQGAGYLHFADDGTNWGAPGNVASFSLLSWSDNQIVFQVPASSGGWATTAGTTATVTVTNAAGATSNTVNLDMKTAVHWPVTVDSGDTTIGSSGDGHMQTVVTIDSSGGLTAMTHIWDTNGWGFMTGFHGATVVTIFDRAGNQLDQWSGGPWGVEGGQSRQSTWTEKLSAHDLQCIYSVSVVNFYDPQYSAPAGITQWILDHASQIGQVAQVVAAVA